MGEGEAVRLRHVILHLGLHKTGTTSFQSVLAAKRLALQDHGVNYIPIERMRRDLTGLLVRKDPEAQAQARHYFDGIEQPVLLLSDENVIGGVADPLWGHVYADAEWRVDDFLK